MALSGRILIGLLLYLRQGQTRLTCEIHQKPLMTVAVVNEEVSFQCEYNCESTNRSAPLTKAISVTMLLYKDTFTDPLQQSKDSVLSKVVKEWNLTVTSTSCSGMYYCAMTDQSNTFKGKGTLLHVEVSQTPQHQVLTNILTGISTALAIYSVSVTVIVLVKGKTWSRCKSCWTKTRSGNVTKKKRSTTESLGGQVACPSEDDNAYMTLRSPQESIYNKLHDAGNTGSTSAAMMSPKRKHVEPAVADAEVYECVYEAY
ncbi:uncharacterized protein [Hemitrygon akajei]|uniref:uncharacterized protein n=1 Tax=Hemitrygon akajei TaxID=2704970 RepID=UPI003BF9666F